MTTFTHILDDERFPGRPYVVIARATLHDMRPTLPPCEPEESCQRCGLRLSGGRDPMTGEPLGAYDCGCYDPYTIEEEM